MGAPTPRRILMLTCCLMHTLMFVAAADGAAKPKTIELWPKGAPGAKGKEDRDKPTLTVHLPDPKKATGTGVIVCPGGGYVVVAIDHEGQQVAKRLNQMGLAAFVRKYRRKPRYQPSDALQDAQRALRHVRVNAKEYGISTKRIGILGFSAGGHLSASSGIAFDEGDSKAKESIDRVSSRPDFMVLIY